MAKILINGKEYEEADITCPDCGAKMQLRDSRFGLFYGCSRWPDCDCTHGAHKATGVPLGAPANKATRQMRIEAHDAFDQLWQGGPINMKRKEAYAWLQRVMGMNQEQAHIGLFTVEQCTKVIDQVKAEFLSRGLPYAAEQERRAFQPGYAAAADEFTVARRDFKMYGDENRPPRVAARYDKAREVLNALKLIPSEQWRKSS